MRDGAVTAAGQSLPSPGSGKSGLNMFLCCLYNMRCGGLFPSVNQYKILLNPPIMPSAQMAEAHAVVRSKCSYRVRMVPYNRTWGGGGFRVLKHN